MDDETPIYQTGLKGWWKYACRYSPLGSIKTEFVRDFFSRARPSARLRQCEIERAYWKKQAEEWQSMLSGDIN